MKKKDHHGDTIQVHVESTKTKKIKCKYKSDGSSADSHEASRGEYVRWSCGAGNYTIVFGEHTPFANPCYSKKNGVDLNIPVKSDPTTQGAYKYSVVVETGVNDHVTCDPQIVIN